MSIIRTLTNTCLPRLKNKEQIHNIINIIYKLQIIIENNANLYETVSLLIVIYKKLNDDLAIMIFNYIEDYVFDILRHHFPVQLVKIFQIYDYFKTKRNYLWINTLKIGDRCDVIDLKYIGIECPKYYNKRKKFHCPKWICGKIIDISTRMVKISYDGWQSKFDEWVCKNEQCILPENTKVPDWKKTLKPGSIIEISRDITNEYRSYRKWYVAKVINIQDNMVTYTYKIRNTSKRNIMGCKHLYGEGIIKQRTHNI